MQDRPQDSSGTLRRLRNRAIRLVRRLPAESRAVSPEIDNDLFQAHLALYRFVASHAAGRRCLDLGCGTGYGSAELLIAGAAEVVGAEVDRRSLAYARKRFGGEAAAFVEVDAGRLAAFQGQLGRFGLVSALGLLPQVDDPGAVLAGAAGMLEDNGLLIASVPPILDGQTMERHRSQTEHRSNLYLWDWEDAFRAHFGSLRLFRQLPPEGVVPAFGSPAPSRVQAGDYRFEEIPVADLYDVGSLSAIFVAQEPLNSREPVSA